MKLYTLEKFEAGYYYRTNGKLYIIYKYGGYWYAYKNDGDWYGYECMGKTKKQCLERIKQ